MIRVGAVVLWSRGLEDDYGPRETRRHLTQGLKPSEPGNAIGKWADRTATLTRAARNPQMKERCAQSGRGAGQGTAHAVNDTAHVFYSRAHEHLLLETLPPRAGSLRPVLPDGEDSEWSLSARPGAQLLSFLSRSLTTTPGVGGHDHAHITGEETEAPLTETS